MNFSKIIRKAARDAGVAVAGVVLAVVINNWTGIIDNVNDALPGESSDISQAYAAAGFAGILALYRLVRASMDKGPDVA